MQNAEEETGTDEFFRVAEEASGSLRFTGAFDSRSCGAGDKNRWVFDLNELDIFGRAGER